MLISPLSQLSPLGTSGGSKAWTPQIPVLTATALSDTTVNLAVTYNGIVGSGYKWERSTDGVTYSVVGTTDLATKTFLDTIGLSAGTLYYYRVRAYKGSNYSVYSNVVQETTFATLYYVKTGGNDANTGLSDAQAWLTINKVNTSSFNKGDRVLFNRGNTWIETLTVPSSGSSSGYITFGSYGTGVNPIITRKSSLTGWNTAGNWTEVTSAVDELVTEYFSNGGEFAMNVRNFLPSNTIPINGTRIRIKIGPDSAIGTAVVGAFIGERAATGDAYDMKPGTISQITFNSGSNTLSTVTAETYSDWIDYTFDKTKTYIVSIGNTGGYASYAWHLGYGSSIKGGASAAAGTANVSSYGAYDDVWYNLASLEVENPATVANTWYKTIAFDPLRLWLSGVEYGSCETLGTIGSTARWYYDSVTSRLYVYSTSNPATNYSNIEIPGTVNFTVAGVGKDYISFKNLDIRGGLSASIRMEGCDNWIIEDNNIGLDSGLTGISAAYEASHTTCNNNIIRRNIIDSGDRIFDLWYRRSAEDGILLFGGCSNWLIYGNAIKDWGHTQIYIMGVDVTYPTRNNKAYSNDLSSPDVDYGRGIGVDGIEGQATGTEVYRNYIHDIGVRTQLNANGLKFHHNIISGVYSNRTPYRTDSVAQGLSIEGYSNTAPHDMEIYNNVIANCDDAGIHIWKSGNDKQNNLFKNNIIFNCGNDSKDGLDDYQIIIEDNATVLGNTFQNNLLYKTGVTDLVYYGHDATNDYPHTIAEFNAENGTASDVISDNIGGDPLFVSVSDFHLQSGSPAKNVGIDVGLTEDYEGNPIVGVPNIGAL